METKNSQEITENPPAIQIDAQPENLTDETTDQQPENLTDKIQQETPVQWETQPETLPEAPQTIPARQQLSEEVTAETILTETENIPTDTRTENIPESFTKYERVPCATPENLRDTNNAIQRAFEMIKELDLEERTRQLGIEFESPDFYIPIAIKESKLDQSAVSVSGAMGYFQITPQALTDVNKWFNTPFTENDLIDKPEVNALIGILLFHMYRDFYPPRGTRLEFQTDKDRELFATFAYNIGITLAKNLWETLEVTSYDEFESKLSKLLIENSQGRIQKSSDKYQTANEYNVQIKLPFRLNKLRGLIQRVRGTRTIVLLYKKDKNSEETQMSIPHPIKITTSQLAEALNFVRVVSAIRNLQFAEPAD